MKFNEICDQVINEATNAPSDKKVTALIKYFMKEYDIPENEAVAEIRDSLKRLGHK
jgi:hypothetical protein